MFTLAKMLLTRKVPKKNLYKHLTILHPLGSVHTLFSIFWVEEQRQHIQADADLHTDCILKLKIK